MQVKKVHQILTNNNLLYIYNLPNLMVIFVLDFNLLDMYSMYTLVPAAKDNITV
jgi:hypothetical protein